MDGPPPGRAVFMALTVSTSERNVIFGAPSNVAVFESLQTESAVVLAPKATPGRQLTGITDCNFCSSFIPGRAYESRDSSKKAEQAHREGCSNAGIERRRA